MFHTLAFRLIATAAGALLLTSLIILWYSHDQLKEIERRVTAQSQVNRIIETLDLLNELEVDERPIVLSNLKKKNLYFISGATHFFFPPIQAISAKESIAPVFSSIIKLMSPFTVIAAGISSRNALEKYLFETLAPDSPDYTLASMVVQLKDSTHVWIGMEYGFFKEQPLIPLLVPIVAVLLPILLVIGLTLYWVLLPLRTLTLAAESIGESLHHNLKLPKSELREIKVASQTIAHMHARLKQQFDRLMIALGALSHDLRTPLQRLRLRVEFIEDNSIREQMHNDIEELHQRVEDGLFYLRSSTSTPVVKPTALAEKINDLVIRYQEENKDVKLTLESKRALTDKCWLANVHWVSLSRALHNVVDNAIVYGTRADITLKTINSSKGRGWLISILDQGLGINENDRERAFEPFVRLDQSRSIMDDATKTGDNKGKINGSGLGLAIAKGVIEQHRGTIDLSNQPIEKGGGLMVFIFLPA